MDQVFGRGGVAEEADRVDLLASAETVEIAFLPGLALATTVSTLGARRK